MRNIFFLVVLSLFAFSCEQSEDSASPGASSNTGVGGSLARFTIVGNYLYTVDFTTLRVFDLSEPDRPVETQSVQIGFGVETIFPLDNWLFLGMAEGMAIFQIQADGTPEFVSIYEHIESCDPVVSDGQYAYVTLRAERCNRPVVGQADRMDVIDISDPSAPQLIASFFLSEPRGLGLDGDLLFVCDGSAGLRVYDRSDPVNLQEIIHLTDIVAYDVIPLNGLLLVVGPDNVYQYDYSQAGELTRISELPLGV